MAYKPSMRRHQKILQMELDIRPVMNLMVVLIPLLLAGSVWTKLSVRNLNLPPKTAGPGNSETDKPNEIEQRLGLTVIISKEGFFVASQSGILGTEIKKGEEAEPTIPLKEDGSYDYQMLQAKLEEIKKAIAETDYSDRQSVMITAESDIPYKYLIKTMDYSTTYTDSEGNQQELFPQVIIGQVVI
jgi:biopolymer transport protein TolR